MCMTVLACYRVEARCLVLLLRAINSSHRCLSPGPFSLREKDRMRVEIQGNSPPHPDPLPEGEGK
jgi:hypothetical protein